jgi:hypothetical protein
LNASDASVVRLGTRIYILQTHKLGEDVPRGISIATVTTECCLTKKGMDPIGL